MNTKNDVKKIMTGRKNASRRFPLPKEPVTDIASSSLATVYMDDVIGDFALLVDAMDANDIEDVTASIAHLKFSLEAMELALGINQKESWDSVIEKFNNFKGNV